MTTTVDHRPVRLGVGVAVLLAVGTTVALATTSASFGLALLGTALLGLGAVRGIHTLLTAGLAGLLVAVTVAGLAGAGLGVLVTSTAGAVLAWETALQAIDLGETLGRAADTTRPLVVHLAGGIVTVGLVSSLGYAVFRLTGGGRPVTALVLALAGALVLAFVVRG